jgi:hypothetical protein
VSLHIDPAGTQAKLSASNDTQVVNPLEYMSLASALQYLTLTHPDLAYAV